MSRIHVGLTLSTATTWSAGVVPLSLCFLPHLLYSNSPYNNWIHFFFPPSVEYKVIPSHKTFSAISHLGVKRRVLTVASTALQNVTCYCFSFISVFSPHSLSFSFTGPLAILQAPGLLPLGLSFYSALSPNMYMT